MFLPADMRQDCFDELFGRRRFEHTMALLSYTGQDGDATIVGFWCFIATMGMCGSMRRVLGQYNDICFLVALLLVLDGMRKRRNVVGVDDTTPRGQPLANLSFRPSLQTLKYETWSRLLK